MITREQLKKVEEILNKKRRLHELIERELTISPKERAEWKIKHMLPKNWDFYGTEENPEDVLGDEYQKILEKMTDIIKVVDKAIKKQPYYKEIEVIKNLEITGLDQLDDFKNLQ